MENSREHLDALELRLSHERSRLVSAKTEKERQLRAVWIAQLEKEITGEHGFLTDAELSDDDLLAELS